MNLKRLHHAGSDPAPPAVSVELYVAHWRDRPEEWHACGPNRGGIVVSRDLQQHPIFQSPGRGISSRPYYNRAALSFSSSSMYSVFRRTRILSASCKTSIRPHRSFASRRSRIVLTAARPPSRSAIPRSSPGWASGACGNVACTAH